MPGPIRLLKYYSDAELQALFDSVKERMMSGSFTSLSGAQKSSSTEWLGLEETMRAINLEKNIRNGIVRPQKVVNIINQGCGLYD